MKTLWVSGAITSGAQNISTVTASGGMVFTGTANSLDTNYNATTGTFFGINAITGERVLGKRRGEHRLLLERRLQGWQRFAVRQRRWCACRR